MAETALIELFSELKAGYGSIPFLSDPQRITLALRRIKEHANLSVTRLVAITGVSRSTVNRWLNESCQAVPSEKEVAALEAFILGSVSGSSQAISASLLGVDISRGGLHPTAVRSALRIAQEYPGLSIETLMMIIGDLSS